MTFRLVQAARATGRAVVRGIELAYATVRLITMLAFLLLVLGAGAVALLYRPGLPDSFTLHINLPGALSEGPGLAALLGGTPALRDLVDALECAAGDPRVTAVFAELGPGPFSPAQTQELGTALARLRAAGKRTLAWSGSFGELSPGLAAYHLAAQLDEVWLQPGGQAVVTGYALETRHYAGLLRTLGIEALLAHHHEYKTVQYPMIYAEATEPERAMLADLGRELLEQTTADIAARRRLDPAAVRAMLAAAPYTAEEALARGLVDRISWRDEALAAVTGGGPLIEPALYRRATRPLLDSGAGTRIALVNVTGGIARGPSHGADLLGGASVGAARLAKAIIEAGDRDAIRAVILRIDSPAARPRRARPSAVPSPMWPPASR